MLFADLGLGSIWTFAIDCCAKNKKCKRNTKIHFKKLEIGFVSSRVQQGGAC
jgi:hypothetical protein